MVLVPFSLLFWCDFRYVQFQIASVNESGDFIPICLSFFIDEFLFEGSQKSILCLLVGKCLNQMRPTVNKGYCTIITWSALNIFHISNPLNIVIQKTIPNNFFIIIFLKLQACHARWISMYHQTLSRDQLGQQLQWWVCLTVACEYSRLLSLPGPFLTFQRRGAMRAA